MLSLARGGVIPAQTETDTSWPPNATSSLLDGRARWQEQEGKNGSDGTPAASADWLMNESKQ